MSKSYLPLILWSLISAAGCTTTRYVAAPCPKPQPIPAALAQPAESPAAMERLNQLLRQSLMPAGPMR